MSSSEDEDEKHKEPQSKFQKTAVDKSDYNRALENKKDAEKEIDIWKGKVNEIEKSEGFIQGLTPEVEKQYTRFKSLFKEAEEKLKVKKAELDVEKQRIEVEEMKVKVKEAEWKVKELQEQLEIEKSEDKQKLILNLLNVVNISLDKTRADLKEANDMKEKSEENLRLLLNPQLSSSSLAVTANASLDSRKVIWFTPQASSSAIQVPFWILDILKSVLKDDNPVLTAEIELPLLNTQNFQGILKDEVRIPIDPLKPTVPNFLLHGIKEIGDGSMKMSDPAEKVQDLLKQINLYRAIIFGPSGVGKTRVLLENLATRFGLYFVCRDFDSTSKSLSKNPGSQDLVFAVKHIKQQLKDPVPGVAELVRNQQLLEENRGIAERTFSLMALCRFLVYFWLQGKRTKKITHYEWLLLQLYPAYFFGEDIFEALFKNALILRVDQNSLYDLTSCVLPLIAAESIKSTHAYLDEAQLLLNVKPQAIRSNTHMQRTLLSCFYNGLDNVTTSTKCAFSGTGLSMGLAMKSSDENGSSSFDIGSATSFHEFQPLTPEKVENYLRIFLKLENDMDITYISKWLSGRHRILVRFLIKLLEEGQGSLNSTKLMKIFEIFFKEQITSSSNAIDETAFKMVQKALNKYETDNLQRNQQLNNVRDMFTTLVLRRRFFNESYVNKEINLVEQNVAFLNKDYETSITEPLILETAGRQIFDDNYFCSTIDFLATNPSLLGDLFEDLIGIVLVGSTLKFEHVLHNTTFRRSYTSTIVKMGNVEIGELENNASFTSGEWKARELSAFGIMGAKQEKLDDSFGQWLHAWKTNPNNTDLPMIFFPCDDAGPDVVIAMVQDSKISFALIQCKLRNTPNFTEAALTVDPELLFMQNRGAPKQGFDPSSSAKNLNSQCLEVLKDVPVWRIVAAFPIEWPKIPKLQVMKRGSVNDLLFPISQGKNQAKPKKWEQIFDDQNLSKSWDNLYLAKTKEHNRRNMKT